MDYNFGFTLGRFLLLPEKTLKKILSIFILLALGCIWVVKPEPIDITALRIGEQGNLQIPIIPGGVGFGIYTPAGSGPDRQGGGILHVTSLADSGRGTLREAVEKKGPRIIVFDVSGYIQLKSPLKVTEPYLTIAGQTAPPPGVSLKGAGIDITTHDVLVQHIRVRVGDDPDGPNPESRDGIAIFDLPDEDDVYNVVIDHVSASWSVDENFNTWYDGVHDVTISNCIISEGLSHSIHPSGPNSKGFLVGHGTHNLLVVGNLFAHNDQRNMLVFGNTSTIFANNVIYNWFGAGPYGGASEYGNFKGLLKTSIVGNVYIRGLTTRPGSGSIPIVIWSAIARGSRIYLQDNAAIETSDDPWALVKVELTPDIKQEMSPAMAHIPKWEHPPTEEEVVEEVRARTPPVWIPGFKPMPSKEVRPVVLSNAGARPKDRDRVDVRIVNDVQNGTGKIIDSQNDVGGWPPLAKNVRGVGGVPKLAIPSNEIRPSGYTAIEEWLHEMARDLEH